MRGTKKFLAIILIAAFSLTLAAGCGGQKSANTAADKKSTDKPALVMSTNATFPPFESVDTSNGTKKL